MNDDIPLHQMDPLARFSNRSEAYARFRPDYPDEAIDAVFEDFVPSLVVVADVGAGTGISSRQLAARGARVLAIEPNREMRSAAEPHPLVEFREGAGEATGLGDESVDVVTVFQAFHWFDPHRALDEFHRILRPGGRIAVCWNERDESDPFTREYGDLVRESSGHHPAECRAVLSVIPLQEHGFTAERRSAFPHGQWLDLAGLVGRARSTSYLPSEGDAFDRLMRALEALYAGWSEIEGKVRLIYLTTMCLAKRP